jgi:hypothetical protein
MPIRVINALSFAVFIFRGLSLMTNCSRRKKQFHPSKKNYYAKWKRRPFMDLCYWPREFSLSERLCQKREIIKRFFDFIAPVAELICAKLKLVQQ